MRREWGELTESSTSRRSWSCAGIRFRAFRPNGSELWSLFTAPESKIIGEVLIPCSSLTILHRCGIRTLGDLAALPETALVSRLGRQGHRLQRLARGEADHLLVPEEAEFTLSETVALDNPVELLDSLLFVLSPMLETLISKAMNRAFALRSIRLTLQLERSESHTFQVRPATPTQSREVLLKLLNLELQAKLPKPALLASRPRLNPRSRRRRSVVSFRPSSLTRTSWSCCSRGCARLRVKAPWAPRS